MFKTKVSDKFMKGCDSIADSSAQSTCRLLFSTENLPLLMSNVANAVGITAEEICEGIGSC